MINESTDFYVGEAREPQGDLAEQLNRIIRGEISAVEAYRQVMSSLKHDPEHGRLEEFYYFHQGVVDYWKRHLQFKNIEPDTSSGVWGYVVEAFVGSAKLLGETNALRAIREGEEHGLNEYQALLSCEELSEVQKRYVRTVIIPEIERHINSIDAMIRMQ